MKSLLATFLVFLLIATAASALAVGIDYLQRGDCIFAKNETLARCR